MNTYTTDELLILLESIRTFPIAEKLTIDSEEYTVFAVKNVANIIHQYHNQGPEKIFEKINEYAEMGRITRYGAPPPLVLVYDLMYEESLDKMPLFIETPYEPIATWRLNLPMSGDRITERS